MEMELPGKEEASAQKQVQGRTILPVFFVLCDAFHTMNLNQASHLPTVRHCCPYPELSEPTWESPSTANQK